MANKRNYFRMKEVAEMFNITTATLRNWIKKYSIQTQMTAGGCKRFTQEEIEQIRKLIEEKYKL